MSANLRRLFIIWMLSLCSLAVQAGDASSGGKQGSIFSRTCNSLLSKTYSGLGIADENLQKMGHEIQKMSSSQHDTDQIHTPFGGGLDGRNVGQSVRQKLNDSDIDWKAMNEIERTLESGKDLSFKQRTDLSTLMKKTIQSQEASRKDPHHRPNEMDNLLLRRMKELSSKLKQPESQSKQQKSDQQNQNPPPQDKKDQQPPPQQDKKQNQDQKPKDSKDSKGNSSSEGSGQSKSEPQNGNKDHQQQQQPQNHKQQNGQDSKPQQNQQHNQTEQKHNEGQHKQEPQQTQQDHKQQPNQGEHKQQQNGQQEHGQSEHEKRPAKQEAGGQPVKPLEQQGQAQGKKPEQKEGEGTEEQSNDSKEKGASEKGNKSAPPNYETKKGISDAILRNLYLWELRKYNSVELFKSGMTNFFNYLANISGSFHYDILSRYQTLVKHQIESIPEDVQYEDLIDFSRRLTKALQDGDTDTTYKYAASMQAKLLEIEKYDALTSTERKLLNDLKALTTQLTSKVDRTSVAVTRKFYGVLPGHFSRAEMHQRFGDGLLTPGTAANEKFYQAILSRQLWSYRFMGLLVPYLNIKEKELYTVSPTYSLDGEPHPRGSGQRVIRNTDDLTEIDNFVDEFTSTDQLLTDVANGDVRYYTRRTEIPDPVLSRKAIKKVSLLISDVSGSMEAGFRTLARNLLQGSYVDHHLSELKTDLDVKEQTGKNIASHVIHHFTFTDHPGPLHTIRTRAEGAQYVKAMAANPQQNEGGGTNINAAIMHALKMILKSKQDAKGDLQWASIVLISDGDDGHIDRQALEAIRNEIGHDTEIHINVILMAGSNHELKQLTGQQFSATFTPDKPPEYSYKELDDTLLGQMYHESQTPPPVSDLEKNAPISSSEYLNGGQGADIRRRLKAVTESATLLATDPSRNLEVHKISEKINKMFKPQRMARPDNSETSKRKTAEILTVIESAVDTLIVTPMPQNVRRVFLWNLIKDLCEQKQLNPIYFDETVAEDQFYRTRLHVSRWLETQKESL